MSKTLRCIQVKMSRKCHVSVKYMWINGMLKHLLAPSAVMIYHTGLKLKP